MSYIHRIVRNALATYRLKPRYYWLTTIVGLLVVSAGLGLWYPLSLELSEVLGVDLNAPVNGFMDGSIVIAVLMVLMVICLYIGVILIAGPFSIYMFLTGRFSKKEAFEYVVYSEYPARWFSKKL